jgi:hypothetical protein
VYRSITVIVPGTELAHYFVVRLKNTLKDKAPAATKEIILNLWL